MVRRTQTLFAGLGGRESVRTFLVCGEEGTYGAALSLVSGQWRNVGKCVVIGETFPYETENKESKSSQEAIDKSGYPFSLQHCCLALRLDRNRGRGQEVKRTVR